MTGAEHYADAERLQESELNLSPNHSDESRLVVLAAAQVHATLALAAAVEKQASEQAASFRAYLERQGKPAGDVTGEWPLRLGTRVAA